MSCRDLSVVKQHQLIARLLKEEIAQWHGFTLQVRGHTGTPCLDMHVLPVSVCVLRWAMASCCCRQKRHNDSWARAFRICQPGARCIALQFI